MLLRRGRLALGGVGIVLALLVAGVWLVPSMLDWNRYRDGIAALASQQLGRPVHIGGGVSLQLLPQPILTANDVSVEGEAGGEHPAGGTDGIGLRAKALRLRVALGALLAGKVDARELTLQGADLRLPWPPQPGALAQRPPAWLTGLRARIEDGRLQVGELVLTGIQGTVETDPDTGTLAVAGVWETGAAEAMRRWHFTARLGRPGRDGTAALDMSLDGQDALRDTGGSFTGQIGADGALSGRVAGRGPDLSLLLPAPALPWRSDGRLNAAGGLAVADELALEIGGAPARGAVALRVQPSAHLDVAITAGRLDLDAWLPALLVVGGGSSLRPVIPTGIDLSAEAATLAGGTVRHLRGGVDLDQGEVRLRDVKGVLPGDAEIDLTGKVGTGKVAPGTAAKPRFVGSVAVKAPDLRTTLRWLQRGLGGGAGPASATGSDGLLARLAALPGGVLHSADLSAQVSADPGQADVTALKGHVDESAIEGSVSVRLGGQPGSSAAGVADKTPGKPPAVLPAVRPAVTARLSIDRVALDGWLPEPVSLQAGALEWARTGFARLRAFDTDVSLSIGTASWEGIGLGAAAMDLQSDAAHVTLRRFEARPAGVTVSASGEVGDGGRVSDGRLEVSAAELSSLRPILNEVAPPLLAWEPLLHGQGRALVLAAGPLDALALRATLDLGDLRLEVQPVANLPERRWAGPLTLHHPGAPRLLQMLGLPATEAWLGDGSLSLVGQASWQPGRFAMEGATLAAGALRASGQLVIEGRRVFGVVGFEVLPLPLVYPRSPDPLPVAWLRGWQAAVRMTAAQVQLGLSPLLTAVSADVTLRDGVLTIARGTGKTEGGTVTGEASLDGSADPPRVSLRTQAAGLALSGPVFGTPLDIVSGHGDVSCTLDAAGYSPAALLATLSGSGLLRVHDGLASGLDLTAVGRALSLPEAAKAMAEARVAMVSGNTSFDAIEAPVSVDRGVVTVDATVASGAGSGHLAGSLDLQNGGLDLQLGVRPLAGGDTPSPGPELRLRMAGPAESPVRTPELAGLARWLADRAP
jgi:hypothetical protein